MDEEYKKDLINKLWKQQSDIAKEQQAQYTQAQMQQLYQAAFQKFSNISMGTKPKRVYAAHETLSDELLIEAIRKAIDKLPVHGSGYQCYEDRTKEPRLWCARCVLVKAMEDYESG